MKFLTSTVLIAIGGFLLQLVFPWWSLVIAALAVGTAVSLSGFKAFLSGLIGTTVVWWIYSWIIDMKTDSILSQRIAELFHVGSPVVIIMISGILAGIAGGLAAATGSALKKSM